MCRFPLRCQRDSRGLSVDRPSRLSVVRSAGAGIQKPAVERDAAKPGRRGSVDRGCRPRGAHRTASAPSATVRGLRCRITPGAVTPAPCRFLSDAVATQSGHEVAAFVPEHHRLPRRSSLRLHACGRLLAIRPAANTAWTRLVLGRQLDRAAAPRRENESGHADRDARLRQAPDDPLVLSARCGCLRFPTPTTKSRSCFTTSSRALSEATAVRLRLSSRPLSASPA